MGAVVTQIYPVRSLSSTFKQSTGNAIEWDYSASCHVTTSRLAQIISGTDVRFTWDRRSGIASLHSNTPAHAPTDDVQEAQVHFCFLTSLGTGKEMEVLGCLDPQPGLTISPIITDIHQ